MLFVDSFLSFSPQVCATTGRDTLLHLLAVAPCPTEVLRIAPAVLYILLSCETPFLVFGADDGAQLYSSEKLTQQQCTALFDRALHVQRMLQAK